MAFSDIHSHILFNCDDGAADESTMFKMLDCAYEDGARYMCFTPHFHPGYFGDNRLSSEEAFGVISKYAAEKYPDLHLALGNELRYEQGSVSWLAEKKCRTLNGTSCVLVDFNERETKRNIEEGIDSLLCAGYTPILAHAERYDAVCDDMKFFDSYLQRGMLVQMDVGSLFKDVGARSYRADKKLLKNRMINFVSSDAHNMGDRPPGIEEAYWYIEEKCSTQYANAICFDNAFNLIFNTSDQNKTL